MEFALEVTPRAEADIQAAYEYIAEASARAATRWVLTLRREIRSLALMPGRCSLAPEAESLGVEIRQLLVGQRGGIYRVGRVRNVAWGTKLGGGGKAMA